MAKTPINQILRDAYVPGLPYGFAERVAAVAMSTGATSLWDLLLLLTPRTGLALGLVAVLLVLLGFVGDGPGLVDSLTHYVDLNSIPPIF